MELEDPLAVYIHFDDYEKKRKIIHKFQMAVINALQHKRSQEVDEEEIELKAKLK